MTIKSALLSLQSLLSTPEPNDPQDAEVARMLLRNPAEFRRVAQNWTAQYASRKNEVIDLEADQHKAHRCEGYHPALIDRFVLMGFDMDRVVRALQATDVQTRHGKEYDLEDSAVGNVVSLLLNEG